MVSPSFAARMVEVARQLVRVEDMQRPAEVDR